VELYNTDGALGAARGAGFGEGYHTDIRDCFNGMEVILQVDPQTKERELILDIYHSWKEGLFTLIK
jgi:xylulokinase